MAAASDAARLEAPHARLRIPSAIPLFLTVLVIFALRAPRFLSAMNLSNILLHSSALALIALGTALIMLTNGIDLSVGSLASLVSVLTAVALGARAGVVPAIAAGVLAGALCGLFNGLVVSRVKLPPFIVTLAGMAAFASLALVISGGDSLYWEKNWFDRIAVESFAGIPLPFWTVVVVAGFTMAAIHLTSFGPYTYGLGNNEEALRLAGVPVDLYKTAVYALNGLLAGIAGVLLTSRVASGYPILGVGLEFEAIASAAIGGISFVGGRGHPAFAMLSALTITMLMNGLGLMGFTTPWQYCAIGLVMLVGMFLNRVLEKLRLA